MQDLSWPLRKYARLVASGNWQHFDSTSSSQLSLQLFPNSCLKIYQGTNIVESFCLLNASTWLRGIANGDKMFFVSREHNGHDQFRVKFSSVGECNGEKQCEKFIKKLSPFLPIKQEQDKVSDLVEPVLVTLEELMENILQPASSSLKKNDVQYFMSMDELETLVQLSVTDHNFSAFVNSVEVVFNKLLRKQ